jgi:threonylcarbamoyladenosine tRNA methylthiotransferase MtaB
MANEARICPHIHLSLQSGNSLILKRMKRRYGANQVRERITQLRAAVPDLVMSADVMVGFPTETEAQYQDTEQMVRDLGIAFPHTFSYSERDGTPAARIPTSKQVSVAERKARNSRLREAAVPIRQAVLQSRSGQHAWVLPEKVSNKTGFMLCRAEDYLAVLVPNEQVTQGKWQKVRYTGLESEFLLAESV